MGDSILGNENEDPLGTRKDSLRDFLGQGYGKQHELLASQADEMENKAMEYLKRSLSSSAEVTPTQGIASALLAAIPVIGGYMLNRGNKVPSMPAGTWMKSYDDYKSMAGDIGPNAGAATGAVTGAKAAQGYLGALDADKKQENKVYEDLAKAYETKATRLDAQDAAIIQGGLAKEAAIDMEDRRFGHEKDLIDIRDKNDPDKQPPTEDEYIAVGNRLAALLGPNASDDEKKQLIKQLEGAKTKKDLNYAEKVMTTSINTKRHLTGDVPLTLNEKDREAVATADNMPTQYRRVMDLAKEGVEELPAGIANAYIRDGLAAIPGTAQQELMSNLESIAMSAAKALGAGQVSDQERRAVTLKYLSALNRGNFKDVIAQDIAAARGLAKSRLNQAALSGSIVGKGILGDANSRWANDPEFPDRVPGDIPQRKDFASPQDYLAALKAYNASH